MPEIEKQKEADSRLVLDPVKIILWVAGLVVLGVPIYLAYCRAVWHLTTKFINAF